MSLTRRQLLAHANEEFTQAYNAGPYTSYKQIELLLNISDVCETGGPNVKATWMGKAGRCTATSMKVAERLVVKYPGGNYDFEIFHVPLAKGGHRFARCSFSGIVIDLVSNIGAFFLPDNETVTIGTTDTVSWRHARGRIYITDADGNEHPCEKVNANRALALCLYEVSRSAQLIVLFRELDPHLVNSNIAGTRYEHAMFGHGAIKWHLKPNTIENDATVAGIKELHLRPYIDDSDVKTRIVWDQSHTARDREESANEVHHFMATHGGPFYNEQWEADGVVDFFGLIWRELCVNYGSPRVVEQAATE
ncbi:hypothetical protein FPOAC2_11878 [Fusarium poae]|uniref:Uncharacterized protein n=1 Tax=Fusarium poae TaxID=36050 RepID=A0A1B8AEU3_FUSPO|nr:hypothetical protein FPOA_10727 [Fusarium poae]